MAIHQTQPQVHQQHDLVDVKCAKLDGKNDGIEIFMQTYQMTPLVDRIDFHQQHFRSLH